jgi:hypothetical protein
MKTFTKQLPQLMLVCTAVIILASCASMAIAPSTSFNNANDVQNIKATVILQDNSSMLGYLTLKNKSTQKAASVRLPKERTTIDFHAHDIKAYEIEDTHYALKLIEPNSQKIYVWGKPLPYKSFVKRLTPQQYEIQLYTYEEKITEQKSSLTKTITHYFVEFTKTNPEVLIDVIDPKFLTQFQQLLSNLQQQCPALDQKINTNDQAYTISSKKKNARERSNILYNIAKLYNECSSTK